MIANLLVPVASDFLSYEYISGKYIKILVNIEALMWRQNPG